MTQVERFTPQAREVFRVATDEARGRGDARLLPAHVALGILRLPECLAHQLLVAMAVATGDMYERIDLALPVRAPTNGAVTPDPSIAQLVAHASGEAANLGVPNVGTEHLLLALLCVGGLAALQADGAQVAAVREYLRPSLNGTPPREEARTAGRGGRRADGFRVTEPPGNPHNIRQPPSLEYYSDLGKRVFGRAIEEARALHHSRVGAEHLLLGLFCQPDSVDALALASLGLTEATTRALVRSWLGTGFGLTETPLVLNARGRDALGRAHEIAREWGAPQVDSSHILLGILSQPGGVADMLTNAGIAPQQISLRLAHIVQGRFLPTAAPPPVPAPGGIVVILTALEVEYNAVRTALGNLQAVRHPAGTIFEVGQLPGSPQPIAICVMGEGTQTAGIITERAAGMFNPKAVLFVGVAGALHDDIRVGDIVVGTRVYYYHGGQEDDSGFHSRPRSWDAPNDLEQLARYVARGGTWRRWLTDGGPAHGTVHFRPIAAGDVVLNSRTSPLATQIMRHYNDSAAIEMEGAGVARAAHLNRSMAALIIRGVSDAADGTKTATGDADWQPMAAASAAAFAYELIASLPG